MQIRHHLAAILSVWKRPYLEEQIQALKEQVDAVYVWHNLTHVPPPWAAEICKRQGAFYTWAGFNTGFLGRYLFAATIPSRYLLVLDDDMIPGPNFVAKALPYAEDGVLVGAWGSRLKPQFPIGNAKLEDYQHQTRIQLPRKAIPVDFFLRGSLFNRQHLVNFLRYPWPESESCPIDDLHFSVTCSLAGVPSVVPPQVTEATSSNTKNYGRDEFASWKTQGKNFKQQRIDALNFYAMEYGWRPLFCR